MENTIEEARKRLSALGFYIVGFERDEEGKYFLLFNTRTGKEHKLEVPEFIIWDYVKTKKQ